MHDMKGQFYGQNKLYLKQAEINPYKVFRLLVVVDETDTAYQLIFLIC